MPKITMQKYTKESLNAKFLLICVVGLGLSVYAYIVESKLELNENYEAMCDIHEHMSCTKAFASEYGRGFGIIPSDSIFHKPNSLYGIIFYCVIIGLSLVNNLTISKIILFLAYLSNFFSIYFAYILYFILADFCIVCVSLYLVNLILLKIAYYNYKLFKNERIKVKSN